MSNEKTIEDYNNRVATLEVLGFGSFIDMCVDAENCLPLKEGDEGFWDQMLVCLMDSVTLRAAEVGINLGDYLEAAALTAEAYAKKTLLDKVIDQMQGDMSRPDARQYILEEIRVWTENLGLYAFARNHGVLINNSAEDFAIEFYTAYNNEIGHTY